MSGYPRQPISSEIPHQQQPYDNNYTQGLPQHGYIPMNQLIANPYLMSHASQTILCPKCRATTSTYVKRKVGCGTWLIFVGKYQFFSF